MKLAIDLDNVSFDFIGAVIEQFGPPLNYEGELTKMWPDVPADILNHMVQTEEIYWASKPIKDAVYILLKLAEEVDAIEYVSARPQATRFATVVKLQTHLFPYFPVVLTGNNQGKARYILQNDFDAVLDDSPAIISSVGFKVKRPYIFTRPWNVNFEWPHRVAGWREFYARVL